MCYSYYMTRTNKYMKLLESLDRYVVEYDYVFLDKRNDYMLHWFMCNRLTLRIS